MTLEDEPAPHSETWLRALGWIDGLKEAAFAAGEDGEVSKRGDGMVSLNEAV